MKSARWKDTGADLRNALSWEGYYGKSLAGCRILFLWCAALALFCTFISYPGIWYSDSYARVTTGNAVMSAVVRTLKGQRAPVNTGNPFTLIPSFFMAVSQGLTGHVALYTFGQAFVFFAAVSLLIRELNPSGWRMQSFLFSICPLIYGMSVYYEAGIGCAVGLIGLMILFCRVREEKSLGDRVVELFLMALCSFVTFGYRLNALTVLPPLLFFLLQSRVAGRLKRLAVLAVAAGMAFTQILPWIFDIHALSTSTAGIVWEMLTVIQRMAPKDQEKYQDYLDEIGGRDSTRGALATSTEGTAGNFMWGDDLGIVQMSAPGAAVTALRKYVQLMTEKPTEWFSVKWDVILRSLGFQRKLDDSEYDYNRWNAMEQYGMVDSLQRRAFYHSFLYFTSALEAWVLRPWVSFLVSMVFVMTEWVRKAFRRKEFLLTLGVAAFYYLAYLLDTPAYDFRYFYPSLLLMTVLDVAILWGWVKVIYERKARKRLETAGGDSRIQRGSLSAPDCGGAA